MPDRPETTDLPLGFQILEDGPGRYVLCDNGDDPAPVYPTREAAIAAAWEISDDR